jgi:hypothetical protein
MVALKVESLSLRQRRHRKAAARGVEVVEVAVDMAAPRGVAVAAPAQ